MWTEWQAGGRGPGLGRWLHFRAARGCSVVVAGSAALAGQDRRLEVSAPVEVRTAAYHASRCALASPCRGLGGSVGLLAVVGGLTIRRSSAALRLLAPPPLSVQCARWRLPLASGRSCCRRCRPPRTQQPPRHGGRRGFVCLAVTEGLRIYRRLPLVYQISLE